MGFREEYTSTSRAEVGKIELSETEYAKCTLLDDILKELRRQRTTPK